MREPGSTPSLVPSNNATVYLVLDDFGKLGRAYRETDENRTNLEPSSKTFSTGNSNDRSGSSRLMSLRVGPGTLQKMFRGS